MEPWTVPPAPDRVLSQWPLAQRVTSITSVAKGDNEMIPGFVHRSPDVYLRVEENSRETSARRRPMKATHPNGVPYFQMRSIG